MLKILIKIITALNFFLIAIQHILKAVSNFRYKTEQININKNEKIIILGNGPSAKQAINSNFKLFKENYLIVVNDFFYDKNFTNLKPKLYLVADPAYWLNNTTLENKLIRTELINRLLTLVDWKLYFYVPYEAFKLNLFQESFKTNKNIIVRFYHRNYIEYTSKSIKFYFYNKNVASPRAGNVVGAAISLMISNCENDILLFGVEHSWSKELIVDQLNRTCITSVHHYDNQINEPKVWLTSHNKPFRIYEALKAISNMLYSYVEIREYADYKNVKIINHTPDSFIDSFTKITEIY